MTEMTDKMLQAKTRLSLREPFFSSILFRFPMLATDQVPLAAVTPRGTIHYNPEAIEKLSVDEILFLLCHEVLHIALSHSLRRGNRDHLLFNIACDALINDMLIDLGIGQFIEGGIHFRGARFKTAEEIYDGLYKKTRKRKTSNNALSGVTNIPSQISLAKGHCDIIYPDDRNKDCDKTDPLAKARKVYGESVENTQLSEFESQIKMAVAEAVTKQKMQGSQSRGDRMGHLLTLLEDLVLEEKLPWFELLGCFMNRFVAQNSTWRRPNKRFQDAYLPSVDKEAHMNTMVVGIDTSGSISDNMLANFGQHLFDVIEECKPEEVVVLWCDTTIRKIERHHWQDVPFPLSAPGRGGTDLVCITHWVNKQVSDADACVIFTDGFTSFPPENSEKVPTLWIITDRHPGIPAHINHVFFEME